MLIIGLTGGIGTGKSTATRMFAELGVPVIDADEIARELTSPGTEYSRKIISLLGNDILGADGNIDRKKLRNIIFDDSSKRHAIEMLLHPVIIKIMLERARTYSSPYLVLSIPLLVEAGLKNIVDRVLVIDSPEDLQIVRATMRDKISEEEIIKVISVQSDRQYRLSQADDIIVNDGSLDEFREEITRLDRIYREISHAS
jgi:dephospho-CoA kinase